MKRFLFSVILLVFCAGNSLFSQKSIFTSKAEFGAGPFITTGPGINANDIGDTYKNRVLFTGMPTFGGSVFYRLSPVFRINLDLAYANYAYGITRDFGNNIEYDEDYSYNYFVVGPRFNFYNFIIGFYIGTPLGGTYTNQQDIEVDIESDELDVVIEAVIGGEIPVLNNDFGELNVIIQGGYFLAQQAEILETNPASLKVGFSYYFTIIE